MAGDFQNSKEATEIDLSKRLFHLKTLCDVSRVLLDQGNIDNVLRNFILMTLGSFGVVEAFVFVNEEKSLIPRKLSAIGIEEELYPLIEKACNKLLVTYDFKPTMEHINERQRLALFPPFIAHLTTFNIAYACNGIFGIGAKIVGKPYTADDTELLETLLINLAITLKNIRSTQALKTAFREVNSINQAKTKIINHLSHELKTPISLLLTSLALLRKPLSIIPEKKWIRTYERAERGLKRLSSIQRGAEDIMRDNEFPQHRFVTGLLDECSDILESLTAEQVGEGTLVEKIKGRIDDLYCLKGQSVGTFNLGRYLREAIQRMVSEIQRRKIDLRLDIETSRSISIPERILSIIVFGLIKNAIENTPDEGRIDLSVKDTKKGVLLSVHDFGTGILAKHRKHIFNGYYPTQATDNYSTKKPFDFNAGGKGADLMRIKIFSERYRFNFTMASSRCRHLPNSEDTCPGQISACDFCGKPEDCWTSGETTFSANFLPENPG